MEIGIIKEDTTEAQTHEIPEVEKYQKVAPEWRVSEHTNITPDQEPRESIM